MKASIKTLTLIFVVAIQGCATSPRAWDVAVDPKASERPDRMATDLAECKQLAIKSSGWVPGDTVLEADEDGYVRLGPAEKRYQRDLIQCLFARGHKLILRYGSP